MAKSGASKNPISRCKEYELSSAVTTPQEAIEILFLKLQQEFEAQFQLILEWTLCGDARNIFTLPLIGSSFVKHKVPPEVGSKARIRRYEGGDWHFALKGPQERKDAHLGDVDSAKISVRRELGLALTPNNIIAFAGQKALNAMPEFLAATSALSELQKFLILFSHPQILKAFEQTEDTLIYGVTLRLRALCSHFLGAVVHDVLGSNGNTETPDVHMDYYIPLVGMPSQETEVPHGLKTDVELRIVDGVKAKKTSALVETAADRRLIIFSRLAEVLKIESPNLFAVSEVRSDMAKLQHRLSKTRIGEGNISALPEGNCLRTPFDTEKRGARLQEELLNHVPNPDFLAKILEI